MKIILPCLYCGNKMEFEITSYEAQGIFNGNRKNN